MSTVTDRMPTGEATTDTRGSAAHDEPAPGPLIPELAAPPQPARPRVLVTGTALASAAAAMVFAGMLGFYLHVRAATIEAEGSWLPEGVTIPLTPGNMALITLVMSTVIMHWAVYAIGNDDRRSTYIALGLAVLMGAAYINEIAFYYTQMGDLTVGEPVGMLIFGITGAHLVMAGIAMVVAVLMAFRTLGGQYSARDREGIVAATLFWDVMVIVYAVIWLVIFVPK
jgi:heme/copper-type cytochrome/quinol oxidase subunit 3